MGIGGDPGEKADIGKGYIEAELNPVDHMDHMAPVFGGSVLWPGWLRGRLID